ncbi:hypothetical protein [Marinoscillum sp. MHG1-6]|uniref:hypothetical protein n=1 Tax=Marinoscillum sp. MHG1-6 TaxID=2959627 RepID=UPI002157D6C7|nr:hypothetical protein [Marinoscillum sp. MHG1-6]
MAYLCLGQKGDFPIKNHNASIPGVDNTTFDMAFDQNGLMYIANRSGILRYDGDKWEFIKTPSAAESIAIDSMTNKIYIGCHASYGYLKLTKDGLNYFEIKKSAVDESFFSTKIFGDSVCFLSKSKLIIYNERKNRIVHYSSPDDSEFKAVFIVDGQVYVSTAKESYKWTELGMQKSNDWVADRYPPKEVTKARNGNYIILDISGKVFINHVSGRLIPVPSTAGEAIEFDLVNDSLFVVGTQDLGCLMVDGYTGKIVDKIDYESGLPDNEVMDIEVDWSMGIWIAHQFGFSRIDPGAPVKCLSNYEGIEGNLLAEINYRGDMFVGTSSGLFKLVYDSVFTINVSENRVKVRNKEKTLEEDLAEQHTAIESNDKDEKGKGLFGIFRKLLPEPEPEPTPPASRSDYSYKYETVKTKTFKYARWEYKKIPEIISKCNSLIELDGVLLIGTNLGLFEYNGRYISRISDQSVKQIIPFEENGEFFTVSNDHQAKRYLKHRHQYIELEFDYDDAFVMSIYHDHGDSIWIVTPDHLVLTGITSQGISSTKEFDFPDRYLDRPTIAKINGDLYFVTKEAYFHYSYANDTLTQDSIILAKYGQPVEHQHDPSGGFWMFDGKVWKLIEEDGSMVIYPYLSLYPEMRYLSKGEQKGEVDFIDENNQFYRYLAGDDRNDIYQSNIFYKHVYAESQYNSYRGSFDLSYDENYLSAEISQPDYLGLLKVEFQYHVEGMDKGWSAWTTDNHIDLDHLPDGKYQLHVRSRDIFGRTQTMDPIAIYIEPPYWQTPWFYFLEVAIFAFLVAISTRLNQKKAQNRFLTEGLTILTIVLIIESMQSVVGSFFAIASSPILDFIVNLSVALLIFPAELFLKKLIKSGGLSMDLFKSDSDLEEKE